MSRWRGASAPRLWRITCIVAVVAATSACGRSDAPRGPGLIVAYPAGLTETRTDGTRAKVVVPAADGAVTRLPAVSPDSQGLAYVAGPDTATPVDDSAADLWVADRDGAHRRRLLVHPSPNHTFRAVRWADDRHLLVVVDAPATCDGCNPGSTTTHVLERVDVETGAAEAIRAGVVEFGLSADGASLVFPVPESDIAESLRVGGLSSGPARIVVPAARGFAQIASPRFSPDGRQIAFAAAESRRTVAATQRVRFPVSGEVPAPLADGLPEDIWVVDTDGSHLRRLAALRDSGPMLEWDPDGSTIYVIGAVALYRVDVTSGADTHIGPGASPGSLAYAPAPSR